MDPRKDSFTLWSCGADPLVRAADPLVGFLGGRLTERDQGVPRGPGVRPTLLGRDQLVTRWPSLLENAICPRRTIRKIHGGATDTIDAATERL